VIKSVENISKQSVIALKAKMNTFDDGFFWNNYKSIEFDFLEFLEFVPYHKSNLKVYSPKLTGLLLQIGGYIDSAFKDMANYFNTNAEYRKKDGTLGRCKTSKIIANVKDAYCVFETVYSLSSNNGGHMIAKLDFGDVELHPFQGFSSVFKSPEWWSAYNKVKHQYSLHYEKASLNNVLEALAGAFLLNVVHYPSIELLWQLGILIGGLRAGKGFTETILDESTLDSFMQKPVTELQHLNIDVRAETPLFLYYCKGE
jgi:hypothetical protein